MSYFFFFLVYAVLFLVLVPCCPWFWHRLRSPCCFPLVLWCWWLLLHQLLDTRHPLADHVRQFYWCLCFTSISRHVRSVDHSKYVADGIRIVAVFVSIFLYNITVGNADFRSQGLLRRPFCAGEDNNRVKVDVFPHSVSQQFSAIATIRSTLITTVSLQSKKIPAMLTNCCRMFVDSVISAPSVMALKS